MVDGKKGTSRDIATQGISSPDGLGISTQGFIEPILGDLVFGGEAIIVQGVNAGVEGGGLVIGGVADAYYAFRFSGTGGLITDGSGLITFSPLFAGTGGVLIGGQADIDYSVTPVVDSNISLGGSASVNTIRYHIGSGGPIIDGDAFEVISFNYISTGGIVTDGQGNINVTFTTGDGTQGGLIIDGEAGLETKGLEFGRGGARIPRRRPAQTTTFEPPKFDPDDYFQPMDYLKKVQDMLDRVEQEKLNKLDHLSKGTIGIDGRGHVTVVYRDKPDGEIVVANNPPLEPIELELPNVFDQGTTAREIAELEDHLFLNDMLGLGNYKIKPGPKARYVHQKKKSTGGSADVKFMSGSGAVKHFDMREHRQRKEDEEFLLEVNMRTRQEQEEEELRLLGIID